VVESPDDGQFSAYAIGVRDCVEKCLTVPNRSWHVATDTYSWVLPVDDEFHLERVELREEDNLYPAIDIFFRWNGEPDLFGITYLIGEQEFGPDALPDAYISIYAEEDLLAMGRGLNSAHRATENGVTWLSWPGSSARQH
jgi:hypothetical protein